MCIVMTWCHHLCFNVESMSYCYHALFSCLGVFRLSRLGVHCHDLCYVYMRYGTIGDGRCTILLFPTCPQSSLRFRRLHVAGNDFIVRDFCRAFTWGIVRESSKGVRYYRTPYANYRTRLGTIANYHTSCKRLKRRDDWEQMGTNVEL